MILSLAIRLPWQGRPELHLRCYTIAPQAERRIKRNTLEQFASREGATMIRNLLLLAVVWGGIRVLRSLLWGGIVPPEVHERRWIYGGSCAAWLP